MSLKSFHIVFITAATVLTFGFGWWCFSANAQSGAYLAMGIASCLAGAGLLLYGKWFHSKSRGLGDA